MKEAPNTVDFETKKIENRPSFPPVPTSVAIRWGDGKKEFLSWGHPSGNNCTIVEAAQKIEKAFQGDVLFHNGAFDMEVAHASFGLRPRGRIHDTLYLAFLQNPYRQNLSLKPMAADVLKMPPDEQEDLKDWIIANVPEAKRKKKEWGAYISEAPAEMVGPYAIGDVDRTYGIYKKFMPEIERRGMVPAYQRELALEPITRSMEQSGIRVAVRRLEQALEVFEAMDDKLVKRIYKRLKLDRLKAADFNLDSGRQLAQALMAADKLDSVIKTPTGQVSTRVVNLQKTCNDPELLRMLSMHSVAKKYITSFMRPWLVQAAKSGGRLLPRFNQVRGRNEDGGGGARTGRYSSSDPNLQNVSANVEDSGNKEVLMALQQFLKEEYEYNFIGLRDFLLPDDGCVMICTDYSQQELRIFAHFENDRLRDAYLRDPNLDVHEFIRQEIHRIMGKLFERKQVKTVVFGILYGMGIAKLAIRLGVPEKLAREIRDGVYTALPGIRNMMKYLKKLADRDKPMVTWGGREYYCEEPRFNKKTNDWMSFEYKMLNYRIQGSAADCTKEGMLNVNEQVPEARIAIQVHDELVCMAPDESYGPKIARAMCDMKFNVPMLAEPKYSTKTWARAA